MNVAVVSAGRPGNVPAMAALFEDTPLIWYVPADQAGDYMYCRATVRPVLYPVGDKPLIYQRNAVLDDHEQSTVAITDDDLRRCAWTEPDGTNAKVPLTASEAVRRLTDGLEASPYQMAGAAPTDNPFFCRRSLTTDGFIRDGITVHKPHGLRYDRRLPLKQDYDMTLQHLETFGGVLRVDHALFSYQQRVKKGGCDYRTPEAEEAAIEVLLAKWPGVLVRHATRPHEVSIRWRAGQATRV